MHLGNHHSQVSHPQEAIESQAIDRVNRLGQKKNVFVYQMVADDTVEDKVHVLNIRGYLFAYHGAGSANPRAKKGSY